MARRSKYPQELMDRGVRLALESGRPVAQVARDLGIGHEALRKRVRQAEADGGLRPDLQSSEEREEIRKLRKEVSELRRANGILKEERTRALTSEGSAMIAVVATAARAANRVVRDRWLMT